MRGRRPLDRMELQSQGPCARTCSSSTASSSAIQGPFRTPSPPPAASLLLPRLRPPLGARAIASTQEHDLFSRQGTVPGRRCAVAVPVLLMGPLLWGRRGERVAHVARRRASGSDPTGGFDSRSGAGSGGGSARTRAVNRSSTPTTSDSCGPRMLCVCLADSPLVAGYVVCLQPFCNFVVACAQNSGHPVTNL